VNDAAVTSFHVILLLYQHVLIVFRTQIALIVAKNVNAAFLRGVSIREIMKVEAFLGQRYRIDGALALRIERCEDAPVLSQNIIDAPHVIGAVLVEAVVVGVAAVIGAEFLISSSGELLRAFEAFA
jgi:hypothetical protein